MAHSFHTYTHTQYYTHTSICTCTLTHEVVVPGALCWDHEEPEEAIREQHLHLLVVGGQVAVRVVARVLVVAAPLKAERSQLVGRQRAGARGEAEAPGREEGRTETCIYMYMYV